MNDKITFWWPLLVLYHKTLTSILSDVLFLRNNLEKFFGDKQFLPTILNTKNIFSHFILSLTVIWILTLAVVILYSLYSLRKTCFVLLCTCFTKLLLLHYLKFSKYFFYGRKMHDYGQRINISVFTNCKDHWINNFLRSCYI